MQLLQIFVKNPVQGKVKTRLAADIGEEEALAIYKRLIRITAQAVKEVDAIPFVLYSDSVVSDDVFDGAIKGKQGEGDLGERMLRAFDAAFRAEFESVVIIGSDCPDISPDLIEEAYNHLRTNDVVIGPATDGGYYLLGMNELHQEIFENMPWSEPDLMPKTKQAIEAKGLSYHMLRELSDVDTSEDLHLIDHSE
jgi:rSAM/selenodomain-associated transferase 1